MLAAAQGGATCAIQCAALVSALHEVCYREATGTLHQAAEGLGKCASRRLRSALAVLTGDGDAEGSGCSGCGLLSTQHCSTHADPHSHSHSPLDIVGYGHAALAAFYCTVTTAFHNKSYWTAVALLDLSALLAVWRMHKEAHAEAAAAASLRRAAADPANPGTTSVSRLDGAELALLQAAAAHSKAAYGAPAANGHVSTAASYLSLVTLGQATRHAPRHIQPAAHLRGVQQLTGCPPADVLAAQWTAHLHRPSFYVALDRHRRSVVVSIRGTLQLGDYATVLDAVPQSVTVCGISGHVHGGFLAAARNLLPPVCAALQAAARACPGWPVLVTGHSLGGGVAAVLTMLLLEQRQQWEAQAEEEGHDGEQQQQQMWGQLGGLRCVGVGAAAAFCKTLGMAAKPYVISVLYGADCLPMFSVLGARLLIEEVHAKSRAAAAIGSLLQRSTCFSWRRRGGSSAGSSSSNGIKAGILPAGHTRSASAASSAGGSLSCELVCGAGGCRGLCTCVADSASEMSEIEDASHPPSSSSTAPAAAGACIGGACRLQRCSSACSSASTASIAAFAAEACADRGAALVPMFPPGRILWLLPPGEQKGGGREEEQAQAAAGLQIVETDQSAFERFLVTLETFHVHLPDNYIQAINAVAA